MATPTSALLQSAESSFSTAQMWLLVVVLFATFLLADAGHVFWHAGKINRWHRKAVSDDIPLRWVRVRNRGSVSPRRPATTRVSSLAATDMANMYLFTSQADCIDGELQDAHFSDGRKNEARLSCKDLFYNPTACSLVPESQDTCCACKMLSDVNTGTSAATASDNAANNVADSGEGLAPQVLVWQTKVGQSSIVDIGIERFNRWVASPTPRVGLDGPTAPKKADGDLKKADGEPDWELIPMMPGQQMRTVATNSARGWEENVTLIYGNGLGSQEGGVDRRLLISFIPHQLSNPMQTSAAENIDWAVRNAPASSDKEVPLNRVEFGFATDDGQPVGGYMYGGTPVLGSSIKFGDFWSFNFSGNAEALIWYNLADCPSDLDRQGEPCPRSGHTLTATRIHEGPSHMAPASPYLFGGDLSTNATSSAFSNQLWVYFRRNDSWVRRNYKGYQPEQRAHHSAVVTSTGNLRFYGGVHEETQCFDHPVYDQVGLCGDEQYRTATSLFFCREHGYRQTTLVQNDKLASDAICMVYFYEDENWAQIIDSHSSMSKICCSKSGQAIRGELFEYNITENEMVRIQANGFEGGSPFVPLGDVPAPRSHHHAVAIPNGMLVLGGDTDSVSHTMGQDHDMFVLLDGWVLSTTFMELEVSATTIFTLQPRVITHAVVNVDILEQFSDTNLTLVMISPSRVTWEPFTSNQVNISVTARNNIFGTHLTRLIFDTTSEDQEFNGGALNLIDLNIVVRSEDSLGSVPVVPRGETGKVLRYPACTPEATVDPQPPLAGVCVPCVGRACPECGIGMKFSGWESWPLCIPCASGRYRNEDHVFWQSYVYECAPCPEGSYQPLHGSVSCEPCEDGKDNPGTSNTVCQAMQDGSRPEMVAAPGWWKISDDLFLDCINRDSCLGNNTCTEGHSGTLCGECIDGWTRASARSQCQKCGNRGVSILLVVMHYMFGLMFIFYAMTKAVKSAFQMRFVKDVVLKILTNYLLFMSRTNFHVHFGNSLKSFHSVVGSASGGTFLTWSLQCGYASISDLPQHRLYVVIGWMLPSMGLITALLYACFARQLRWLSLSGACGDDFAAFLVVYMYTTYAMSTSYLLSSVAVYKDGRLALASGTFAYEDISQAPWTLLGYLGIILWSIVTPLAMMGIVFYYKRRYGLDERRTRVRVGYLINGYQRRFYYWEAFILARQVLVISVETQMLSFPDIFSTIFYIILGVIFLVFHLERAPFDNRFHKELSILEKNSLAAFITTNILDAALQMNPESVEKDTIRWPYLAIVVYLNLRFLLHTALMLGHSVLPLHCVEYASERLRALLVSNKFVYVLRRGELRFKDLMQCERDYLALILHEIDYSFCNCAATLRHLRLGGTRHEVVKKAVIYYYRSIGASQLGAQASMTSDSILTDVSRSRMDALSGTSQTETSQSQTHAVAEFKEQLHLQHLRDKLDIPHCIKVPIDSLYVEIMRQCSVTKFLQALCSEDNHTQKEELPILHEADRKRGQHSDARLRGGHSASRVCEDEAQRINKVALQWIEETAFGHLPPLAETRSEESWHNSKSSEDFCETFSDSDTDDERTATDDYHEMSEHWNILNANVVQAMVHQMERDAARGMYNHPPNHQAHRRGWHQQSIRGASTR